MTEVQNKILRQFRSNVEDILTPLHTDDVLLKFLRARNFNVEAAEMNLRAVESTRSMFGIDCILENYSSPEVCERYGGDSFLGFAKDGSAVRYMTSRIDFLGFMNSISSYDLYKYFCYVIETDLKKMREERAKDGRYGNEITYIMDFDNFSLTEISHKCIIESGLDHFQQFQDFYPEVWRYVLIVNVPSVFDMVYSIFKPILRERLREKIMMATKSGTKSLLLKYIDEEVLPAFLGGSRLDSKGDPNCSEFVRIGSKIPDKYYLKNCRRYIEATDAGVTVAVIAPRSVLNVSIVVRKCPTRVNVDFRTEGGSISLGVLYRDFGPDPENPVLPAPDDFLDPRDAKSNVEVAAVKMKSQCHMAPIDGIGLLTKPGIYIIQFDNTSSWFGSRKLLYRISFRPGGA